MRRVLAQLLLGTAMLACLLFLGCDEKTRAVTNTGTTTDLSGTWFYSGNGLLATLTLIQSGTGVSGTLVDKTPGSLTFDQAGLVSGTVTGTDVVLDVEFPWMGASAVAHFASGTIGSGSMSGIAGMNGSTVQFSWQATKQ
jgi:hypothetical protein